MQVLGAALRRRGAADGRGRVRLRLGHRAPRHERAVVVDGLDLAAREGDPGRGGREGEQSRAAHHFTRIVTGPG